MGIFTLLTTEDLATILQSFGLQLVNASGVPAGSVNTYYKIQAKKEGDSLHSYYLRIDERRDEDAVKRELEVLSLIYTLNVPRPLKTLAETLYIQFRDKPAILFSSLSGSHIGTDTLSLEALAQVGQWLGGLHCISIPRNFPLHRFHPEYLFSLYTSLRDKIAEKAPTAFAQIEKSFNEGWQRFSFSNLPEAIIHADLFADNLLFDEAHQLSGVLDFEAAGRGPRLLDLAIALQALCFNLERKQFDLDRATTLGRAYLGLITPTQEEIRAWPDSLTYSALRFLITRLKDFELGDNRDKQNDYRDYRDYLEHLRDLPRLHSLLSAAS